MRKKRFLTLAILSACLFSASVCQACISRTPAPSADTIRESGAETAEEEKTAVAEKEKTAAAEEKKTAVAEKGKTADAEKKKTIADGKTVVTDSKTSVPDGTYEPSAFSVQGGTGKVTITCPEVVVTDGDAQACIVFSSPYYEWVEAEGVRYDPENTQEEGRENSVFRIPVLLDEERRITGLTTAMSEPHEVEYTIAISLTQESLPQNEVENNTAGSNTSGSSTPGSNSLGSNTSGSSTTENSTSADEAENDLFVPQPDRTSDEESTPPDLPGLAFVSKMETAYAETFDIYTYRALDDTVSSGVYRLIDVHGSGRYLLLPEADDGTSVQQDQPKQDQQKQEQAKQPHVEQNQLKQEQLKQLRTKQDQQKQDQSKQPQPEQPQPLAELPASITVLRPPLDNLYVAATSSMALFDAAGAIGQVRLTGTKAEGWYIDAPKKALLDGSMLYAGKYSAPDYELLASSGCDLAVESMMILHAPEVKEKLEELGIPVFIDTSSNESHPLGRTEWVRLYGVLTGHEEEAEAFFDAQRKKFAETESYTKTGSSVAFFSISSNGNVIVRAADDYIPRMIGIAGGTYVFENLLNETGNSASVRLSMEDFYNTAKDADYLIYNATIEKPVGSITEFCGLSPLLADFKAVRSGRVWQVRRSLYQSPDLSAQMIGDIHEMLTENNDSGMVFLEKVN